MGGGGGGGAMGFPLVDGPPFIDSCGVFWTKSYIHTYIHILYLNTVKTSVTSKNDYITLKK